MTDRIFIEPKPIKELDGALGWYSTEVTEMYRTAQYNPDTRNVITSGMGNYITAAKKGQVRDFLPKVVVGTKPQVWACAIEHVYFVLNRTLKRNSDVELLRYVESLMNQGTQHTTSVETILDSWEKPTTYKSLLDLPTDLKSTYEGQEMQFLEQVVNVLVKDTETPANVAKADAIKKLQRAIETNHLSATDLFWVDRGNLAKKLNVESLYIDLGPAFKGTYLLNRKAAHFLTHHTESEVAAQVSQSVNSGAVGAQMLLDTLSPELRAIFANDVRITGLGVRLNTVETGLNVLETKFKTLVEKVESKPAVTETAEETPMVKDGTIVHIVWPDRCIATEQAILRYARSLSKDVFSSWLNYNFHPFEFVRAFDPEGRPYPRKIWVDAGIRDLMRDLFQESTLVGTHGGKLKYSHKVVGTYLIDKNSPFNRIYRNDAIA